jgi:gluconolactonase
MSRHRHLFACLISGLFVAPVSAQILPPGATVTRLATGFNFTEGPVYDRAGGVYFTNLVFSNQFNSDIIRYDLATRMASVVEPTSDGANGLSLDANGQVISADQATHRISRRSAADITVVEQVLANSWNGTGFNSPNDLVIDASGGIYFSDPDYNNVRAQPEGVYYRNPAGTIQRILTGFARPNGVMLSPDGETFYLAVEGEKRIIAYDVAEDGSLSNQRQFARTDVNASGVLLPGITNGPDGLTVDAAGNLYAAVQNAVFAWNPSGQRLFDLPVPQDPTNVAFGGSDGRMLFITAGNSLYGIELNLPVSTPGDYSGDMVVDAADYVVWRNAVGSNDPIADGNDDGIVDIGDFDLWRSNFGISSVGQSAAAVPETCTAGTLLIGIILFRFFRHRKLRGRDTYYGLNMGRSIPICGLSEGENHASA